MLERFGESQRQGAGAKLTNPVPAHRCSRVLLELEILICARNISFAVQRPAKGQQTSSSLFLTSDRGTLLFSLYCRALKSPEEIDHGLVDFVRRL